MPGRRALIGIMRGIKRTQADYQKIKAARDTKRQKDELFELQKKKYQLQIEEMKTKGEDDPMLKVIEEQLKDQFKVYDAQSKVDDNSIANAQRQNQEQLGTLKRTGAKVTGALMKQRRRMLDWTYNTGSRSFTIKPLKPGAADTKITPAEKALGALKSGGMYNKTFGEVTSFETREEAETFARMNLGVNWKTRFPEAIDLIDQQFGIDLPGDVKTTSGAVKYLMENKGMDKPQAIQYLRQQHAK